MATEAFILREEWNRLSGEERQKIIDAVHSDAEAARDLSVGPVRVRETFYVKYGKRLIDICLGGIACALFAPVNLLIAVVTYFDVGSPIIFRQRRVGKDEKAFSLVKFRNMTNEKNAAGVLLPPDQRVTKWGRFVRKTSLDELLNFWSIFKGDMSLIGPRPLPMIYLPRYSAFQRQRHLVKPGLECPFHDSALAGKGWQGRFENDIWYVQNISFKTDVMMAFRLVKKVFSKDERSESAEGKTGEFIGYFPDGSAMDEYMIPRKYLGVIGHAGAEAAGEN